MSQDSNHTKKIALEFAAQRDRARSMLRQQMDARGFTEQTGWKISESLRHVTGGTELVMRPIHLRERAPEDLQCIVAISEEDGTSDLRT
jgi:hypothetical protein